MSNIQKVETPPQALMRILTAGKRQLEIALGDAMDPNRMIRLAMSAMHQNPGLGDCSMVSIANSVMLAAQLRLEINTSLGHAWLIPYAKVCTFQPGYRGLIELAHRSPETHDVTAHVVYSADTFEIEYGDEPRCTHKPFTGNSRDRGQRLGAYAVIRYKQGPANFLFMNADDIEDIRDKSSKSKDSDHSPWKRFADEMWRKTPTKRMLKYCRLSIEDLSRAVGLDDQAEAIAAGEQANGFRAGGATQELAIEGELLDMADEATHNLRGSMERQEQVAEEKLAKAKSPEPQRPLTDAELDTRNRELDREIVAAESQSKPKRKLF